MSSILPFINSVKKKIIVETPFNTTINILQDNNNNLKRIIDDNEPEKKEQYDFITNYATNVYNIIKQNEVNNILELPAEDNSKTLYFDSLLKSYIKEYLIVDINNEFIDNLDINVVKYNDTINLYERTKNILNLYFKDKLDKNKLINTKILCDINSLDEKTEKKTIDIFQFLDIQNYNNTVSQIYNNVSSTIQNKLLIDDPIYDFTNETYIIDKNFNLPDKQISNNKNIINYKLNSELSIQDFIYNRLRYEKTINNNEPDQSIIDIFTNTFDSLSQNQSNLDENDTDKTNTIQKQLNILLNSLKNRADILKNNKDKTGIILFKGYLSKGVIQYYTSLLNDIYNTYYNDKNYITQKIGFFRSMAGSIIYYKTIFQNLYNSMNDTDVLNLVNLNKYVLREYQFITLFFIEMKPILDGYKKANEKLQVKLFININDNPYEFNLLSETKKKIIGVTPDSRIFNKVNDTTVKVKGLGDLKFNKVFYDTDPVIMSAFMSISNSLNNLEGTILYTFGASGVGKSFTLFGKKEINKQGIVQATLKSLDSVEKLKIKVYEIYGLGFNDKSYWNSSNVYEKYIVHYLNFNGSDFSYRNKKDNVLNFDEFANVNDAYTELNSEQLKDADFSKLIDTIDSVRKSGIKFGDNVIQTIKPTANNPESSRSILVYEFIICKKLSANNIVEVPLILIDMPGKELISNTYNCPAAPKICSDSDSICPVSTELFKTDFLKTSTGYKIISSMKQIFDELFPDSTELKGGDKGLSNQKNKSLQSKKTIDITVNTSSTKVNNDYFKLDMSQLLSGNSFESDKKSIKKNFNIFYKLYKDYMTRNDINVKDGDGIPKDIYEFATNQPDIKQIYNDIIKLYNENKLLKITDEELKLFRFSNNFIDKSATKSLDVDFEKNNKLKISGSKLFTRKLCGNIDNKGQKYDCLRNIIYIKNVYKKYIEPDLFNTMSNFYNYMIELGFTAKNIKQQLKDEKNIDKINNVNRATDILQTEIGICKLNTNDFGYLPDKLCLNLATFITDTKLHFSPDFDEEGLKTILKEKYDSEKPDYQSIPSIIAEYTYKYYTPPYGLYKLADIPLTNPQKIKILTKFFEQIFEGIYINENINGIMQYMLNKNKNQEDIIPDSNSNIYDEGKLFNKNNLAIQKLFDYYNNDQNVNKAKIENYISFFLSANISTNDSIKSAIFKNTKIKEPHFYDDEMKKTQVEMYRGFQKIIMALAPADNNN
jgi:hypothetical protein